MGRDRDGGSGLSDEPREGLGRERCAVFARRILDRENVVGWPETILNRDVRCGARVWMRINFWNHLRNVEKLL